LAEGVGESLQVKGCGDGYPGIVDEPVKSGSADCLSSNTGNLEDLIVPRNIQYSGL